MQIYKREIIDQIVKYLNTKEVIALYGARQVGKTFILYWLRDFLLSKNKPVFYLDLEDIKFLTLLNKGPEGLQKLLLENGFDKNKKTYVLLDEIQYLKNPTNFLKLTCDHYENIKLIVSGSSTLEIKKKFGKALVGRAVVFEIFGLSFAEFLVFKGYQKPPSPVLTDIKKDELGELFTEFVLFGSYPKIALLEGKERKEKYLWQIIETYLKKDIRDIAEIKEIEKFNKLLEVLSSQSGKLLNIDELANTCHLAKQTIQHYLFILENTYVLKLVKPFYKNLRSELFKTPKVYFYDSGLAHLLWLKVIPKEILGEIFETAVFAEMVKHYGKEAVNFWRTKDKKEIDFILRVKNKILPIETKLNFSSFSQRHINYFLEKYKLKNYYCLGLQGTERKNKRFIFPWDIAGL